MDKRISQERKVKLVAHELHNPILFGLLDGLGWFLTELVTSIYKIIILYRKNFDLHMKNWKMVINKLWMKAAICGEEVDSCGHTLPQLSSGRRVLPGAEYLVWSQ